MIDKVSTSTLGPNLWCQSVSTIKPPFQTPILKSCLKAISTHQKLLFEPGFKPQEPSVENNMLGFSAFGFSVLSVRIRKLVWTSVYFFHLIYIYIYTCTFRSFILHVINIKYKHINTEDYIVLYDSKTVNNIRKIFMNAYSCIESHRNINTINL